MINNVSGMPGMSGGVGNSANIIANFNQENQKVEDFSSLLKAAESEEDLEELREACNEFETYFVNLMLKEMRATTNLSGEEKSQAEVTFQEMLDQQYAELATEAGGIGVADFMYNQMESAYRSQIDMVDYMENN